MGWETQPLPNLWVGKPNPYLIYGLGNPTPTHNPARIRTLRSVASTDTDTEPDRFGWG